MAQLPRYVWRLLSSEEVFENPFYRVVRDRVMTPAGRETDYWVFRPRKQGAGVVAIDDAERVLLVRQWRHPVGKLLWGVPAGAVEAGEEPIAAAGRELIEETGYAAAEIAPLLKYHPMSGTNGQTFHLFLARKLARVATPDAEEIESIAWRTREEVEHMLSAGEIEDGMALVGLMRWLSNP